MVISKQCADYAKLKSSVKKDVGFILAGDNPSATLLRGMFQSADDGRTHSNDPAMIRDRLIEDVGSGGANLVVLKV